MNRQILLIAVALAAAAGIAALAAARLFAGDIDPQPTGSADTGSRPVRAAGEWQDTSPEQVGIVVESLVRTLDEEIAERRALTEELETLRAEIDDLRRIVGSDSQATAPARQLDAREREQRRRQAQQRARQSVEERLASAGFSPAQVAAINRRQAEQQMLQVDLDDRARREGWLNTPRYFEELQGLSDGNRSIRSELGDDAYDRYLFATGTPNRIQVDSVIQTSPAEQAGLQPGDVIQRYGGEAVFSARQLVEMRSQGERGTPVTVDVLRDGQLVQITMPRGPMGVQTRPDIVNPAAQDGT